MPCSDLRCGVSNLPIITSCYQCGWHWTLAGSTWLAWKPSEGTPRTVSVGDSPLLPSETTCDAQLPYLKNVHCLAQYSPLLWAFSFYTTFSASTFLPPSHPSYYILLLLSVFFFFFEDFISFLIICMGMMCTCKGRYPSRPATRGRKSPWRVWIAWVQGIELGSLQEHQTLLTTEPSLQTLLLLFKLCSFHTLISN